MYFPKEGNLFCPKIYSFTCVLWRHLSCSNHFPYFSHTLIPFWHGRNHVTLRSTCTPHYFQHSLTTSAISNSNRKLINMIIDCEAGEIIRLVVSICLSVCLSGFVRAGCRIKATQNFINAYDQHCQ